MLQLHLLFMQESLDNVTLFSIITVMSFILNIPVALFMEGVKFTPSYLQAAVRNSCFLIYLDRARFLTRCFVLTILLIITGFFYVKVLNVNEIYTRSLLAALCFHAYQQVIGSLWYMCFLTWSALRIVFRRLLTWYCSAFRLSPTLLPIVLSGWWLLCHLYSSSVHQFHPLTL